MCIAERTLTRAWDEPGGRHMVNMMTTTTAMRSRPGTVFTDPNRVWHELVLRGFLRVKQKYNHLLYTCSRSEHGTTFRGTDLCIQLVFQVDGQPPRGGEIEKLDRPARWSKPGENCHQEVSVLNVETCRVFTYNLGQTRDRGPIKYTTGERKQNPKHNFIVCIDRWR